MEEAGGQSNQKFFEVSECLLSVIFDGFSEGC
jgi:hypothetical protein